MVEDAVPIFFCAEGCSVPAEVVDSHRAVSDRLVGPEPDLPFFRLGRKSALPGFSRLLFHDHEGLAALDTAGKVVLQGDGRVDEVPGNIGRFRLLVEQHFKKARIVVQGGKIEILVEVAQIDVIDRGPDIVGGHEVARTRFAKHAQLFFQERHVRVRLVAIIVESESGIGIST